MFVPESYHLIRIHRCDMTLPNNVFESKYANLQIICQTYGLLLMFYHAEPLIFIESAQQVVVKAALPLYHYTKLSER